MSGWGRFTFAVYILFGVITLLLVAGGVVGLISGAWPIGLVCLVLALVAYVMTRSVKRSLSDLNDK